MTMKVTSARFGVLDIEEGKVIAMPDGMAGFNEQRFIILNPGKPPFYWYQAVDNPDLAFVVVNPAQFVADYQVKLTREESDKLLLVPHDEALILAVVTMAADPRQITINLQGPIVINPARMTARQMVLDGNYTTRAPLFGRREPLPLRSAAAEEAQVALSMVSLLSSGRNFVMACP